MDDKFSQRGESRAAAAETLTNLNITQRFTLGPRLYSTLGSSGYEAVDTLTGQSVVLWTLKNRFPAEDERLDIFMDRLDILASLDIKTSRVRGYGVDAANVGFWICDRSNARGVFQTATIKALERRFVELLQAVEPVHQAGIFLGDISADSFLLAEGGQIQLNSLLGIVAGMSLTGLAPELISFVPRELLADSTLVAQAGYGQQADVYALGILAYYLFTSQYPVNFATGLDPLTLEDIRLVSPSPLDLRKDLPFWVERIIAQALSPNLAERYKDVSEMLEHILSFIQGREQVSAISRDVWAKTSLMRLGDLTADKAIRPAALSKRAVTKTEQVDKTPSLLSRVGAIVAHKSVTIGVSLIVLTLLGTFFFVSFDDIVEKKIVDECGIVGHADFAPAVLKPLIFDIATVENSVAKRAKSVEMLAKSKDPIAYAVLVALTKCKVDMQIKETAERLLVSRISEKNLLRSARVVEEWIASTRAAGKVPSELPLYGILLRACDLDRPVETRQQALREAFSKDKEVSVHLAAALSLDIPGDSFNSVFRSLLSDVSEGVSFDGRSSTAMIMAYPSLSKFFGAELPQIVPSIADEDLLWLLELYSQYDNTLAMTVIREVTKRNMLSKFNGRFLKILIDNSKTETLGSLERSLLRAALGKIEREDISQFAPWTNIKAEELLLLSAARAKSTDVKILAIDSLAGRSLLNDMADELIKWVKNSYWEERGKLAGPIAVLSLADIAEEQEISGALNELMPYAPGGGLFRVLVREGNQKLIELYLDRTSSIVPTPDVLPLLKSDNPQLRIAALKALEGRNDIMALQEVVRAYKVEKDEEVKSAFKRYHPITVEPYSPKE